MVSLVGFFKKIFSGVYLIVLMSFQLVLIVLKMVFIVYVWRLLATLVVLMRAER